MFKSIALLFSCLTLSSAALALEADDWKLCRASDSDKGIPACTRLAQNGRLSNKERSDAYVELGLFFVDKDKARGIATYDKAIAMDPKNTRAYIERARAHNGLEQYEKAAADATKAIELDPRSAFAYQVRGFALREAKELDRSISDYNKALELEPNQMRYFERAGVFLAQHETDRAVADLKSSADQAKGADDATNGLLVQIVEKLISIDRIDDTAYVIGKISDHETILLLRSRRPFEKLWSNASASAALSLEQQRLRDIALYRAASERLPKSLAAKYFLIKSLVEARHYAEAEQIGFESVAMLSSFDDAATQEPWVRSELAEALVYEGKFDSAQNMMDPVLRNIGKPSEADYVSGTLNYSEVLLDAGRFRAALDTAKKAEGHVSTFGSMVMRYVQACSTHELGQQSTAASIIDSMSKDAKAAKRMWFQALTCTGPEDKAAQAFIDLVKPYPDELKQWQGCASDPDLLPFDHEQMQRQLKVLERPEVRSVLEPIGRLQQGC